MKYAYFAGGCFWCITPVFAAEPGVVSVESGYCGGDEPDPSYEDVKAQRTRHRETVRVAYDEALIGYPALLDLFTGSVDVEDGEGQFIDRGRSYTLAVYTTCEEERIAAERTVAELGRTHSRVCISIEPYKKFYRAEERHQDYYKKEPEKFAEELISSGRGASCPAAKRRKKISEVIKMERVCRFLKDAGVYYLATDDNGQPRVRPFGTAHIYDGRLYIQTGKKKDVSKQLHKNPKAEICAFKDGVWLRLCCELIEDDRYEARKSMLDAYPELRSMYDENDGNTEVFYCRGCKAVFSSFTSAPETVEW